MPLLKFIKYNNAVPIAVSVMLLGAGGAFAATDPTALYSSSQRVVTVDNTYLANKDLSTYTPTVQITGVTEDTDNYYVAYTLDTIDVQNYVWQNVTEDQSLTVAKNTLGQYGDLGVYVTGQLKNVINNDLAYLQQVQTKARASTTQETVATSYGGLVGKLLNDTTQTLPGYTPVVVAPPTETAAAAGAVSDSSASSDQNTGQSTGPSGSGGSGGSSLDLSLQVLGNDPAHIALNASYVDLGVVLLDPTDQNIGYKTFVDGTREDEPQIDTSTSTSHVIEYRAVDQAGNTVIVRRIVLIGTAADPGGEILTAGSISGGSTPASSTPVPAPTPPLPPPPSTPQNTGGSNSGSANDDSSSGNTATTTPITATSTSPDTSGDTAATSTTDSTGSGTTGTSDASTTDATSTGQ